MVLPPGLESAVATLASRSLTFSTTAFQPLAVSGAPVVAVGMAAFHAARAIQANASADNAPTEKSAPLANGPWIFIRIYLTEREHFMACSLEINEKRIRPDSFFVPA